MDNKKTIYVDFDGTLAAKNEGRYPAPGKPIRPMIDRVKRWIREGHTVKIFTARLDQDTYAQERMHVSLVTDFCEREGLVNLDGSALIITNRKGLDCDEIWDDRAVSVNEYGNYTSMHKTAAAYGPVGGMVGREDREAAEQQMWSAQLQQATHAQQQYAASQYATSLQNWALQESGRPLAGSQASTLAWLAVTNAVDPPQDNPPAADTLFEDLDAALTALFEESEIWPGADAAKNPCYCMDSLNVVCDIHRNDPPDPRTR